MQPLSERVRCPQCGGKFVDIGPIAATCNRGHETRREAYDGLIVQEREHDGAAIPLSNGQQMVPPASELVEAVRREIQRYVVAGSTQLVTLALWVLHTWAVQAAETTPYLSITSPEPRSGKTRLLEVLELLVRSPWMTARVSAAVLVRKMERDCPTLLLDETDAAFRGDKQYAETLRGVLNAGWRRGGKASLCVLRGRSYELVDFRVFGPKAIAGLRELPNTVADRAIPISLQRRVQSEKIERFRIREAEEATAPLREKLQAWAEASIQPLAARRPHIPSELDDRAAEGWEPLLAIADLAGEDWPELGRNAAVDLSAGDARSQSEGLGIRLLRDIRTAMAADDAIPTARLLYGLIAMDDAPWGDLPGKPLDARALGRLLKPYGITSQQIRVGPRTGKGYRRENLVEAWARYCPSPGNETSETSETQGGSRHIDVSDSDGGVSDRERPTLPSVSPVSDVSLRGNDQNKPPEEPRCEGCGESPARPGSALCGACAAAFSRTRWSGTRQWPPGV